MRWRCVPGDESCLNDLFSLLGPELNDPLIIPVAGTRDPEDVLASGYAGYDNFS